MKQTTLLQNLNLLLFLLFFVLCVAEAVKVKVRSRGPYDQIIATPPPLDYDGFQPQSINYAQGLDQSMPQPSMDYTNIDPNQVQYIVDPLSNMQYYSAPPVMEGNSVENVGGVQQTSLPPKESLNSTFDYQAMIENAQKIANSGEKLPNIITNEENAYKNYFNNINSMEYNSVINSNLDKPTMNKAYAEMFNPSSNKVVLSELNNIVNYPDIMKSSNMSLPASQNMPIIDLPTDRSKIEGELAGFYKYYNGEAQRKFLENAQIPSSIPAQTQISNNRTNSIKNETNSASNSTSFPRFKAQISSRSEVTLENLFSGMDESEKDRLVNQIKHKNRDRKERMKKEWENCQNNCISTCERIKMLKKTETSEVCLLKCKLACSNNILNKLL